MKDEEKRREWGRNRVRRSAQKHMRKLKYQLMWSLVT